jgi:uncharacterized Rmd1/YagE family protein
MAVRKGNRTDVKAAKPIRISAFHIADTINIKHFKAEFKGNLISSSSSDLFYSVGEGGLLYIFNYGVIATANVSEVETSTIISHVKSYAQNILDDSISDDYKISLSDDQHPRFEFDDLYTPVINNQIVRVVMFNVAQSVALDYYCQKAELLLEEVNRFTTQLEKSGRIRMSKRSMLKFIGRTLNAKNRVIENLYIFDVPDIVWEDKFLDEINSGMVRVFDLRTRYKEVQTNFKNIEDNLAVFRELYQHRMSNLLEWIIIVLILIEVIDLFIKKLIP